MRPLTPFAVFTLGLSLFLATPVAAQPARPAGKPPSVEDKTASMKKLDGFLPVYWDEAEGKLYLEVANFGVEILHFNGFAAGLVAMVLVPVIFALQPPADDKNAPR